MRGTYISIAIFIAIIVYVISDFTIESSECRKLGYTHGMQNGLTQQMGCKKIDGDMVITYNHAIEETYIEHSVEAGKLYKLK